jgi:hypothetical protein
MTEVEQTEILRLRLRMTFIRFLWCNIFSNFFRGHISTSCYVQAQVVIGPKVLKGLFCGFNGTDLIQAKSGAGSIASCAVCVCKPAQSVCGNRVCNFGEREMKKAILEKGSWGKFSKPKVVSVATPAKAASERQVPKVPAPPKRLQRPQEQEQKAAPQPRVVRVVHPQQGVGVPPAGRVMEGQRVESAASTTRSKPSNLRQTGRIDKVNQMQTNTVVKPITAEGHYSNSPGAAIEETSTNEKASKTRAPGRSEKLRSEPARRRSRDLQSGMELLGLDFLLSIVEDTASNEDLDVTMRRLNFKELIRTDQLHAVDSNALKVYALNADGHYDKTIQCEAIKELTARTTQGK